MAGRGREYPAEDRAFMQRALALAARGYGGTSPNPMVGAVIVRDGKVVGEGFHRRAGEGHAEVNAIAHARGPVTGTTLYVTLEPCCTEGRTPPCTDAIARAGIRRVVVAARDPNPKHAGRGLRLLRHAGIEVQVGLLAAESLRLNEAFNYWVVHRRPFVHLKCAMSLDGKIATNAGESKWITGPKARIYGMRLRLGVDAIVVGVNTVNRDDPHLTIRGVRSPRWKTLRKIILDPEGRVSNDARLLQDENTTVVVGTGARRSTRSIAAPRLGKALDLSFVLAALEGEGVTSVLVEGGGETHYNFLAQNLVNRVHFFYAPKVITGRSAPKAVGGAASMNDGYGCKLRDAEWKLVGRDLLLTALVS